MCRNDGEKYVGMMVRNV